MRRLLKRLREQRYPVLMERMIEMANACKWEEQEEIEWPEPPDPVWVGNKA